MKRVLSLLSALALACACFAVPASADAEVKLPFELEAPSNVSVTYLDENDSPNTCEIHYSQNTSMSEWSSRIETEFETVKEELAADGYDDLWIKAQIDWSIDTQDDWHVNEYWLTEGYDEDYHQHLGDWAYIAQSYSADISMSEWIFRGMGNIDDPEDRTWYGQHDGDADYDGWKDVLKEDQYEIVKGDGESYAKIDLTEHTIYTRVRWLVTLRTLEGEDIHIPSEWSEIASVGKDAETLEPLKPGDIAPPVISDLKYTDKDYNGYPVISFKLDVSDELKAQLAQAAGTQGSIWLCTETRVQGKDEWAELQGDWVIKSGDMELELQNLAEMEGGIEKDTPIELRARYYCTQNDQEDFWSDYSETLTFGSVDMQVESEEEMSEAEVSEEESVAESKAESKADTSKAEDTEKSSFPWWILLLILLVIIVIIIIIIITRKKKDDEQEAQKK